MTRTIRILSSLSLLAPLCLAPLVAVGETRQEVKINVNGEVTSYNLEDFKDGETRTVGEGSQAVTVTRKGDSLQVVHDGQDLGAAQRVITVDAGAAGGAEGGEVTQKRMVFVNTNGETADIEVIEGDEATWVQQAEASGKKVIVINSESTQEDEQDGQITVEKKVIKIVKVQDEAEAE